MLPNIVHCFTMEKFKSLHLGNTERKNPNLCPSTGDLILPPTVIDESLSVVTDKVRSLVLMFVFVSLYVIPNNVEHLCNSNLLLYSVNLNMYK